MGNSHNFSFFEKLLHENEQQNFPLDKVRELNEHNVGNKAKKANLNVPGGKKCSFFEKFGVLCFLTTSAIFLYYRR